MLYGGTTYKRKWFYVCEQASWLDIGSERALMTMHSELEITSMEHPSRNAASPFACVHLSSTHDVQVRLYDTQLLRIGLPVWPQGGARPIAPEPHHPSPPRLSTIPPPSGPNKPPPLFTHPPSFPSTPLPSQPTSHNHPTLHPSIARSRHLYRVARCGILSLSLRRCMDDVG